MSRFVARTRWLGPLACIASLAAAPRAMAAAPPEDGRALFAGERPFRNGGPPCAACHDAAGLAFPGGGTLGPDLTTAFSALGPQGLSAALQTLYFPTMQAIFGPRPLTAQEAEGLAAFLQQESAQRPDGTSTGWMALISVAGFAAAMVLTWLRGMGRVRSVRAAMVEASRLERRPP